MATQTIELTPDLKHLCLKWNISKLEIFGSFSKDLQTIDSDVDLLVTFSSEAQVSLLDHVRMKRDFETYFDRNVDIISQSALLRMKNDARKKDITDHLKVIYAA